MGKAQSRIKHLESEVARLHRLVEILARELTRVVCGHADKCDVETLVRIREGLEGRP